MSVEAADLERLCLSAWVTAGSWMKAARLRRVSTETLEAALSLRRVAGLRRESELAPAKVCSLVEAAD